MKRFQRLSIKGKLIAIITLASSVSLLVTVGLFTLYESLMYREAVAREMQMIAQILSESTSAALVFQDARAARETLAVLRGEPRVVAATLYSRNGKALAEYRRASGGAPSQGVLPGPAVDQFLMGRGDATLNHTVRLDGEKVGTLYLRRDLDDMWSRLTQYGSILAGMLVLSVLAALLVSSSVQGVISRPILHLAQTAERVRSDNNYSIRAVKETEDELGLLVDRFNEMMERILQRDRELQQAQDGLELRVDERTLELKQEVAERRRIERDLIAAKQTAEESSRSKSAFLANMSHELRTPLNAIIGYSEMLAEEAVEKGQAPLVADLGKIRSSGKHLLELINDVLDLSKIEAGRVEVRKEWVSISDVIREAVSTAQPLARRANNRLVVERDWAGEQFYTDAVKFRQSLLNLLSNACKFSENGTVTLGVRDEVEGGRRWLLWSVTDTGIGISPEGIRKLFQSFSQVDSSATRKYGGTGLGLAISKRLCQLMGGDITVESQPGVGSTFTIRVEEKEITAARFNESLVG